MKSLPAIVLGVTLAALVLVASSNAVAARAGGRNAPPTAKEAIQEQYDAMIRECKLTEDQQKTLKEKCKAKEDALDAWEKTNAEKIKAVAEAVKAARTGDADAKKKAGADQKALAADRLQATAAADKAILDVLTADQKTAWEGCQLFQTTVAKYKKANLTEDENVKIKAACAIASKEMASLSDDDKKDKRSRAETQNRLKWAIDNVILTPEQRETVAKKPAAKAPAAAPAAPATVQPAAPAAETKPDAAK
jgi:hypothetical protein